MRFTCRESSEEDDYCKLADGQKVAVDFSKRVQNRWIEASGRFHESASKRQRVQGKLGTEKIAESVEGKERVSLRRGLLDKHDALGLERVLGKNDLLQVNFLARGMRAAKSVCRVLIASNKGAPDGYGTGFLVSPGVLLTNHHVLPGPEFALYSAAEFDFNYDEDFRMPGSEVFPLAPQRFFYSNPDLDFTLVAVQPIGRSGRSLTEFGHIELIQESGKALATESIAIIQHPAGRDKHVSLRNSRLLTRFEDFLHYESDTLPGSSGSPVFSDQWSVVALHHCSIPETDSMGNIVRKDGQLWQAGESHESIHWIANEGVRISSIFADLKACAELGKWSPSEIRVLEEFASASQSSLHSDLAKASSRRPMFVESAAYKHPIKPAMPMTVGEFKKMLYDETTSEEKIAPYFELSEESRGIDPLFRLNPNLVIEEPTEEIPVDIVRSSNWVSARSRHAIYHERCQSNRSVNKVIAVGDSWIQYPFRIYDTVDHLINRDDLAILSFGEAGDRLRDIVAKTEFLTALHREKPAFFLLSAGANDLFGGEGIRRFLKEPESNYEPEKLIDRVRLAHFRQRIEGDLSQLIRIVLRTVPNIKIIYHGYSYPVPNAGPWLGKPMNELGIRDLALQRELVRMILDEFNGVSENAAGSFKENVTYIDVRDTIPAAGWFDECHPTSPYFGDIAQAFVDEMRLS
jgi:V8-like Glu-specific endopeptidase